MELHRFSADTDRAAWLAAAARQSEDLAVHAQASAQSVRSFSSPMDAVYDSVALWDGYFAYVPSDLREVEGDALLWRNVRVGGNAEVQGSALVHHDLFVKGWLVAPNIRGLSLWKQEMAQWRQDVQDEFQDIVRRAPRQCVVDRGPWTEGETYFADELNPDSDLIEISDVWLWGCRWRAAVTHTADPDNRPGWGSAAWTLVSGDRTLRLRCSPSAEDIWISMAQTIHVSFRVFAGEEDVTDFADAWSIRRESADDAADAVWDNRHLDFQGSVSLSAEDLGPAPHARFTITATLRDPADGGPPRMSAVSCQLSA